KFSSIMTSKKTVCFEYSDPKPVTNEDQRMTRKPQTTVEAAGIFRARLLDFLTEFRKAITLKDFLVMLVVALSFGGFVEYARAEIYKCTGENGNLIYSQKPCGADAEAIVIKDTTSGVSMTGDGDFAQVDADRRVREIDRAIERRERTIQSL